MKTNLEELNYRFRKELLNNYGYKLYFELLASNNNDLIVCEIPNDFNYYAWVKGLFKKDGIDDFSLVESILPIFNENLEIDDAFWSDKYRREWNMVDIFDISQLVAFWVHLFYC